MIIVQVTRTTPEGRFVSSYYAPDDYFGPMNTTTVDDNMSI